MEPGSRNRIEVHIPSDHPSGTYWYHTHKHGSVTFQFLGGMAGLLIIRGGSGTLDALPEIKAAKDLVMAFQEIRTNTDGNVVFVNQQAIQFGTFPIGSGEQALQGICSTYGIDGAPGLSFF
jgi:FtsP/CotA-like multicopper oxidase with cupredoxin domain